jgi:hypothetical protein
MAMRSATLSVFGLGLAIALVSPSPAGAAVATAGATQPGIAKTDLVQEVRRRGHHFYGGRHHFRGHFYRPRFHHARPHHRFWRHRHRHGFRIYIGPTWYGGYHYRRCGWLRARALATGSPYWWRRYRICRRYY